MLISYFGVLKIWRRSLWERAGLKVYNGNWQDAKLNIFNDNEFKIVE